VSCNLKCFPGSTVGDMSDYVKPILRRKPDNIILHVGTNDTSKRKATEIMNDIDRLCQEIKEAAPDVEIVLSELTKREDNEKAKQTVNEVNKLLENYCTATNLSLITHNNITNTSLNRSHLHLNRYGSSIFARNIIKYLIILT
ncbi:Zinc finger MYM-type 1, partial [Paramuricea clavata]